MNGHILRDLGEIVQQVRENLELFDGGDIQLSPGFKKAFSDYVSAGGNHVAYKNTTAVITNAAGQKIYAPNQWFVLAAYPVELVKEIIKYRNITENMIEAHKPVFENSDRKRVEKKDIYKRLKEGDEGLKILFENCMEKYLDSLNQSWEEIQINTDLLMKFVTDDKWWLGGKGIERTNDFYLSPVLGSLNLVNVSQSYVATIAYAYVSDERLYRELDTMIASPADGAGSSGDQREMQKAASNVTEYFRPEYHTGFETGFDRNKIVFGAPGTGKSYKLRQQADELTGCAETHMERVTFHSDYTYSQFVGCYKPVTDADGTIRYDFIPGPFMRVYVNAIRNTQQMMRAYDLIGRAHTMYLFPTNPNPADEDEKWDLFEEITEAGQEEVFHAPREAKEGDLALIYLAKTKPGYENGIYAIGTIVEKERADRARIRFDYVSYDKPVIDYGTLKPYKPNIRSSGKASDSIVNLVKETVLPANPYLLLIEEINRAKVAAVFGDVFQLLDRGGDGASEYGIQTSEDVRKYLASELGGGPDDWMKIKLPDNMFIWATMNSADQGVFPMDTAFKRRWEFEYLGINDGEAGMKNGTVTLGADGEHRMTVNWNCLRKAINERLAGNDFKVNEDKLMGPFFLSGKVTEPDEEGRIANPDAFIRAFKSKVIMYLYEDAAKQHRHRLFSGCDSSRYSSVCEAFDEIGIDIFGDGFRELYSQQEG